VLLFETFQCIPLGKIRFGCLALVTQLFSYFHQLGNASHLFIYLFSVFVLLCPLLFFILAHLPIQPLKSSTTVALSTTPCFWSTVAVLCGNLRILAPFPDGNTGVGIADCLRGCWQLQHSNSSSPDIEMKWQHIITTSRGPLPPGRVS